MIGFSDKKFMLQLFWAHLVHKLNLLTLLSINQTKVEDGVDSENISISFIISELISISDPIIQLRPHRGPT